MSSWFWDDCGSMSDFQKEYVTAFLDGKMPDLINEIRETAEKFDNDVRKSREAPTPTITEEQNKNHTKIPWFLMIRANSLNHWFYWMVGIAANKWLTKTIETVRVPYDPNDPVQLIVPLSWTIITLWFLGNFYLSIQKRFEADNIRKKMLDYQKDDDFYLNFDFYHFGINRGAIIRYLSKNNPGIFYKLIRYPSSVKDNKVAENIILGHVRACPGDAQSALDTFGKSLSAKAHRRLQRYKGR